MAENAEVMGGVRENFPVAEKREKTLLLHVTLLVSDPAPPRPTSVPESPPGPAYILLWDAPPRRRGSRVVRLRPLMSKVLVVLTCRVGTTGFGREGTSERAETTCWGLPVVGPPSDVGGMEAERVVSVRTFRMLENEKDPLVT